MKKLKKLSLKTLFNCKLDIDTAEFHLGIYLGLWDGTHAAWQKNKGIFWSRNIIGYTLYSYLEQMVKDGILKKVNDQYEWRGKKK